MRSLTGYETQSPCSLHCPSSLLTTLHHRLYLDQILSLESRSHQSVPHGTKTPKRNYTENPN